MRDSQTAQFVLFISANFLDNFFMAQSDSGDSDNKMAMCWLRHFHKSSAQRQLGA
ncbi:hypothetical protein K432DRAFT_464278 [Lepidopterella palustris CBS 459.81]|uniref:Uncharacterized protein n=1 Tax=Lepidopterella palustris CBS 459.81 TaxID=1314670 RepID=A0A8E2E2L1_9PEZI|nr:hypothetical protein K432DRAFT_464278 [Lepidopterella palustris CBS 459.81]